MSALLAGPRLGYVMAYRCPGRGLAVGVRCVCGLGCDGGGWDGGLQVA